MTTIHLSGPADILTVLPYQLGFHPRQCVVAVSLRGTRMGLVQRIDLPPLTHIGEAVEAMIAPLRAHRPKSVLLFGFEEREGESRPMLDELAEACRATGVSVDDRVVVRDGRWFDLDCVGSCCPSGGLPLPAPSGVPAVAEFVGREIWPLADRSALADQLEPDRVLSSSQLAEVSGLADDWLQLRLAARPRGQTKLHGARADELAIWASVLSEQDGAEPIRELPLRDVAKLAVSLTDVGLRDGLIAWLCPGALPADVLDPTLFAQMRLALPVPSWLGAEDPGDLEDMAPVIGRQRIERRLCELCAALPDAWAASTLTVLASFTWWRGDGALTRVALDRALRVDPHYRLAQLLERMVDLAIRPVGASA